MPTSKLSAIALAALLTSPFAVRAQRDLANVEIKATAVAGNVHMLEGQGGNIAVSTGPDGVLVVDNQFLPLAEKINAAIEKLDHGPIKFVLNTHWHGDHTGGNPYFGRKAPIVAHTNVRKRLAGKPDAPKESLPSITYDAGASLHVNGEEVRVFHLGPAHTDGDSVIHFTKSGVYHLGDQFTNGRFPFIDLGSGGSLAGLLKNIEALVEKIPADARIIPGHGALATHSDLKAFHQMLLDTVTLVKQAKAAGKTVAEVKAAGMPEKYKDWGAGFINQSRWLEIAFNNLETDKR